MTSLLRGARPTASSLAEQMGELRRALMQSGAHPTGIAQGDVWEIPNVELHLDLDMAAGRDPSPKGRPVLVVERDERCRSLQPLTVLVVPVTSTTAAKQATSVLLPRGTAGLVSDSLALVHLVQPVLRRAVTSGRFMGAVDQDLLAEVLAAVGALGVGAPDKLTTGNARNRPAVPDLASEGAERTDPLTSGHLQGMIARRQIVFDHEVRRTLGGNRAVGFIHVARLLPYRF